MAVPELLRNWVNSPRGFPSGMAPSDSTPEESWRLPLPILWIPLLALALRGLAMWRFDSVTFDSAVYFEMADLISFARQGVSLFGSRGNTP